MSKIEIVIFDVPHENPETGTTRIEAVVRHSTMIRGYALHVRAYFHPIPGDVELRSYPLSGSKYHPLSAGRFSSKNLAALATDPHTHTLARTLAGLE